MRILPGRRSVRVAHPGKGVRISANRLRFVVRPSSALYLVLLVLVLLQISCPARMFENLSAGDLKKKMDEGTRLFIVDLRTPREYQEGHVPTSVNVPPDSSIF